MLRSYYISDQRLFEKYFLLEAIGKVYKFQVKSNCKLRSYIFFFFQNIIA